MIRQKTAIIVGAGSSIDIIGGAFPSGDQLLKDICEAIEFDLNGKALQGGNAGIRQTLNHQFNDSEEKMQRISAAARSIIIKAPTYNSIDQLVRDADDVYVSHVAKLAIGYFISHSEMSAGEFTTIDILNYSVRNNWLVDLLLSATDQAATLDQAKVALSNLVVVCFNYDRLIEHLRDLFLRAKYFDGLPNDFNGNEYLKVIHPYGTIGDLVIAGEGSFGNRFESTKYWRYAERISENLLTFSEAEHSSGLAIRTELANCVNLAFFGFGFGEENLELILPDKNPRFRKSLFATKVGVADERWPFLTRGVYSRLKRGVDGSAKRFLEYSHDANFYTSGSCRGLVDEHSLRW